MAQSWCGRCQFSAGSNGDCPQCSQKNPNLSVFPSGSMDHFDCHQDQDHFGTEISYIASRNAATMLPNVMGGPAISRHGIYPGDYLHTAPGSNDVNSAASVNQYLQLTDNQTCSWDIVVPQVPTTEAQVPSELPSTYSFETSQPDEMPNPSISSVEWNDATIDSLYTSQHQPMPDFGPLSQWDTQYPDYSQFPTSFSSIDNSVNAAQTTPFQADLGSYYPPSYVEQYLLDIEAREDDGLSIHVRIPPSIPGAMYYGTHLMSEFSQEADGTIDVRVHLPAGYARISSTFVHA